MSLRPAASRYAKALLDVAIAESDAARIERDLAAFVSAVTSHAELRQALMSPRVPTSAKQGVVRALVERSDVAAPLARVLDLLARRGRLELLPELLAAYRERLLAHQNVVQGLVTSAAPLPPDTVRQLAERLGQLTGKTVQLTADIDPSLIGGLVARVGSTVYDGSVRTQLEKMKQGLVED